MSTSRAAGKSTAVKGPLSSEIAILFYFSQFISPLSCSPLSLCCACASSPPPVRLGLLVACECHCLLPCTVFSCLPPPATASGCCPPLSTPHLSLSSTFVAWLFMMPSPAPPSSVGTSEPVPCHSPPRHTTPSTTNRWLAGQCESCSSRCFTRRAQCLRPSSLPPAPALQERPPTLPHT